MFAAAVCVSCARQPLDLDAAAAVEGDAPLVTSAGAYVLTESGGGFATEIPVTFHNVTGATLYIVNCRGALAPTLERQTDAGWQRFWTSVQLLCLSPPIVIAPNASIADTVRVWGALPGRNAEPSFRDEDLDGTYRIVLDNVVHNYDASHTAGRFGDPVPLEQRVSNTFRLRRQ